MGGSHEHMSRARPGTSLGLRSPNIDRNEGKSRRVSTCSNQSEQRPARPQTAFTNASTVSKAKCYFTRPASSLATRSSSQSSMSNKTGKSLMSTTSSKPPTAVPAHTLLAHQQARRPTRKAKERERMQLHFHTANNQELRTKTSKWQSDFTTEVTIAPSQFRHRDFADEKYLERFVRSFKIENSKSMQIRIAKDQGDLREFRPETKAKGADTKSNMSLVFKPLDKDESMATRVKAYTTGVHRQWIDPKSEARKERSLRNTFPEAMKQYDPEPKLFVRNFRTLRPSDKMKVMGEYRDPTPIS